METAFRLSEAGERAGLARIHLAGPEECEPWRVIAGPLANFLVFSFSELSE